MTIRKGTNIIIGQVPTDTSITSTGIYPVTGAAIHTALGLKANDSSVVHKTGDETITGIKTFNTAPRFRNNLTPSTSTVKSETIEDILLQTTLNTNNAIDGASIIRSQSTSGNREVHYRAGFRKSDDSGNQWPSLVCGIDTSDNAYTKLSGAYSYAPQPNASDSTSIANIATCGWVNDATKSTNVVHRDGTETISGVKTFSSKITSSVVTNSYLAGNQGTAIINSTSAAGSYTMLAKMNSTNGYMTLGTYQGKFELHYTAKSTVDAGTNTYTKQAILLDEDGNSEFPGTITGTATKALWADLAENYQPDKKYPVGTLIKFGGEKDITIASDHSNGVISNKPGYLLDNKLEDSQPIALVGKTPIRIIGKVKKFDKIVLSEIPGVGRVLQENEDKQVIARALENNDTFEEKLVMCVTKFNLD